MALLEQVLERLDKFEGNMGVLKNHFETMQKRLNEGPDAIRKVLGGAGPVAKAHRPNGRGGYDGSSTYEPGVMADFYKEVAWLTNPQTSGLHMDSPELVRKSLNKRGAMHVTQKAAMQEGTGNLGGFLVPPEYKNELYKAVGEKSILREKVRVQPMAAREFNYPALDQGFVPATGQSAYYGGMIWSWEPEAANYNTLAQTNPVFRNIKLVCKDCVGMTLSSNQLLQDSPLTIEAILNGLFQDSVAWNYDYYIINGLGSNQPLGFLNAPGSISVTKTTSAHVTMVDVLTMMSQFLPSSWGQGMWLAHPSCIPDLAGMTNKSEAAGTTSGFLIWLNQLEGAMQQKVPALLMGMPIIFTEKLPKLAASAVGPLCLVDPSMYLLGDRLEIQVESSQWPFFTTNQMAWRIVTRWDGQPLLNKPITLADGAFTVSPFVYLTA